MGGGGQKQQNRTSRSRCSMSRLQFFITSLTKIQLYDTFIAVRKVVTSRSRVESSYFPLYTEKKELGSFLW